MDDSLEMQSRGKCLYLIKYKDGETEHMSSKDLLRLLLKK